MKQVEDNIFITIKCDDASKEFFITGMDMQSPETDNAYRVLL
jgi:hypothetical protein